MPFVPMRARPRPEPSPPPPRPPKGRGPPRPAAPAPPAAAPSTATEGAEPHAAVAAGLSRTRAGEVPHRVLHALLQGDAEDVACALAGAERLEESARGDDGMLVAGPFRSRVATRSRLAARLAFLTLMARDRLPRILAPFRLLRPVDRRQRIGGLRRRAHDQRLRPLHFRFRAVSRRRDALPQHLHSDD